MDENTLADALARQLFAGPGKTVLAAMDGASVPELRMKIWEHEPEHYCLFRGDLEPDMAEVAPYLVKLEATSAFTRWVLTAGWGKHWGVFVTTSATPREMRGHFRSIIDVFGPDGEPLIFRYYDPRVLPVFLPTCNTGELNQMFGKVSTFQMETDKSNILLCLKNSRGRLEQEMIDLNKI